MNVVTVYIKDSFKYYSVFFSEKGRATYPYTELCFKDDEVTEVFLENLINAHYYKCYVIKKTWNYNFFIENSEFLRLLALTKDREGYLKLFSPQELEHLIFLKKLMY